MENKNKLSFWLPAMIVCLGQIGTSGDNSVVGMAMNEFINTLGATMDEVQLANIVYSLMTGALMVFGGMLGIAKGFKNVFIVGLVLASAGELIAAFSPSIEVITWGARVITGLGAALLVPSILGVITSLYEGKYRAIAFGAVGAATGVATVLMPLAAGFIMDNFGYRAGFTAMSGWFFIVFLFAIKFIPSIKPTGIRLDIAGTVFATVGLFAFIIGCSKISVWGLIVPLNTPFTLFGMSPALFMVAFGIFTLFITFKIEAKVEAKHGAALIPQSFIRTRQVRNGLYVTGLIFILFGAAFFVAVSWMMVVANWSATLTGAAMVFMATPLIATSLGIPRWYAHVSPRKLVFIGTGIAIASTLMMLNGMTQDGLHTGLFLTGFALFGAAQGIYASQSAMIVSSALNPRDAAQSGGIQTSTRNIWQAAGVAIIGAVLLFSSTELFKNNIATADVSPTIQSYVLETPVHGMMSNEQMLHNLMSTGATEKEAKAGLQVYKHARLQGAKYAYYALLLLIVLHIPGFFGIQTTGWESNNKQVNSVRVTNGT